MRRSNLNIEVVEDLLTRVRPMQDGFRSDQPLADCIDNNLATIAPSDPTRGCAFRHVHAGLVYPVGKTCKAGNCR